ncbi:L,D-transpeptidase [Cohaesibacter celericrescens]|uniref:L,D-transpeptidase n=1 Tax=Cohaesibacter celericrescens TaxID=2067669 RepID=UPI00356A60CB
MFNLIALKHFQRQCKSSAQVLTRATVGLVCSIFLLVSANTAMAGTVRVKIDISSQKMYVSVNGGRKHSWSVSTARRGYRTPTGNFRPTRMYKRYFSKKYHGSPMPYSIFFYGGYAIHGTNATKQLGRPASHGCIRLHPKNARQLFALVQANGPKNTKITIQR